MTSTEKLGLVVKTSLEDALKPVFEMLKQHITDAHHKQTMQIQEQQIALARLEEQLTTLEKSVAGEKRKPVAKAAKEATASADATGKSTTVAAKPAAPLTNKLAYFRKRYVADMAYRERYASPDLTSHLETDPSVTSKTKEDQKINAMANSAYKWLTANKAGFSEELAADFAASKVPTDARAGLAQSAGEPGETDELAQALDGVSV